MHGGKISVARLQVFGAAGSGLDMFTFSSTEGVTETVLSDEPYDFDTRVVTCAIDGLGPVKYAFAYYGMSGTGIIVEDFFYFDRELDAVLSWTDANVLISYADLTAGETSWF